MEPTSPKATAGDSLLAAAKAGNASAFWQLTETYRPYLRGVVARILGAQFSAKVDASDVVQQCLLTAFERFGQFRGADTEQWQHWLLALVRNQTRKIVRYWYQEMRDVRREQSLTPGSSDERPVAAEDSTPSQQAARRERAARLMAVLQRLPQDYRQVISLRNFEDLPYAEVAARMNRSEEAVRKLWERAIRRLREEWGDQT
jgi:RNA polymerase sigma-70 factor (ECF subfamily)